MMCDLVQQRFFIENRRGGVGGLQGLAKAVAWDGEGATTLLEVGVTGAADDESAQKVLPARPPAPSWRK